MVSSSEVIMVVSSTGVSSSTINPYSLSWVSEVVTRSIHVYCESTVHPLVWLWHALHAWCRGWAAPSFLLCFLFVSLPWILHQNWHVMSSFSVLHHVYCNGIDTSSLHFLLFSSAPWILWRNRHIIAASPFLLSHHLLPLVDTLSLHLHFIIIFFF